MRFYDHVAVTAVVFASITMAENPAVHTVVPKPPHETIPADCSVDYLGAFNIGFTPVDPSSEDDDEMRSKHKLATRTLVSLELTDGYLVDDQQRMAYIDDRDMLQFEMYPRSPQFNAGFSICKNGTIALGNSALWYRCRAGAYSTIFRAKPDSDCALSYIIREDAPVDDDGFRFARRSADAAAYKPDVLLVSNSAASPTSFSTSTLTSTSTVTEMK
jgi:hypothetical protein